MTAAILDIDGTLVDSNYQHTRAWQRGFAAAGIEVAAWMCHRHIGMGGDRYVAAVAGDEIEERLGDEIRDGHQREYKQLIGEVRPFEGAVALIEGLAERDVPVVLASSAKDWEVEHYIELLDVEDEVDAWTTSADVDSTKPAPELVEIALGKAGDPADAFMIGDTNWDCEAALRAGVRPIGVLSGGFGEAELREAGAVAVYHGVAELRGAFGTGPLRFLDPD